MAISQYFSRSEIAVFTRFGRLKIWAIGVVISLDFFNEGLVTYLLEFE